MASWYEENPNRGDTSHVWAFALYVLSIVAVGCLILYPFLRLLMQHLDALQAVMPTQ